MPDLRIERGATPLGPAAVGAEQRRSGGDAPRDRREDEARPTPGVEELAVALHEEGRAHLVARLMTDESGETRVRIVDTERDETVAVLTPDELRTLAAQTGLPAGLLLQARS
jgi:hypothetical protein